MARYNYGKQKQNKKQTDKKRLLLGINVKTVVEQKRRLVTNEKNKGRSIKISKSTAEDIGERKQEGINVIKMEVDMRIFYFLSKNKVKVTKPKDCKMKITILKEEK